MCGLAGFARHPDAPGLKTAIAINRGLTHAAMKRGKHATGFAVLGPTDSFLKKWAMPFSELVKLGLYKKEVEAKIPDDVHFVMSHTRHATLDNKTDEAAAHPFAFPNTVGCHNGTITNWRKIAGDNKKAGKDWVTDSQAALWLIDTMEDPADALMALDGWWALAWVKGGKLLLTRTVERPLAVAFVPSLKTLFWASNHESLKYVLKKAKRKFKSWELTEDTIYEFDPTTFNKKCSPTKTKVKLDRPSKVVATTKDVYVSTDKKSISWNKPLGTSKAGPTMAQFMADVDMKIEQMEGRLESAEAEISFLYDVIDDMGGLDGMGKSECNECGEGGGQLLKLPDGGFVHAGCVFT